MMSPQESASMAAVQAFLDDVVNLEMCNTFHDWYQLDVAAMLDGCKIEGHEVDEISGESLIFLNSSLVFCSPLLGIIRHYPRSLIHCFIEDRRKQIDPKDPELLFKGELFSVTPEQEQLCWTRDCIEAHQIPEVQSAIANWMRWLNKD
jgi:hypothetical protein